MKLGEKLQQLRKQSGLSQEQLAARLTVSRQAVSKWELDETMPDTENVIQLSRLFGVSCDYLLRDEVDEQGVALPDPQTKEQAASDAPEDSHSPRDVIRLRRTTVPAAFGCPTNDRSGGASAAHLDEQGWVHNARVLSMAVIAIGLLIALGGWLQWQTTISLIVGLVVQILGVVLFELAVPRMGGDHKTARITFYMIANWFLMPIPTAGLCWWTFDYTVKRFLVFQTYNSLLTWAVFLSCDLMFSAAATAVLGWLRWRQSHKK